VPMSSDKLPSDTSVLVCSSKDLMFSYQLPECYMAMDSGVGGSGNSVFLGSR
jgi:hypothetical protein